MSVKEKTTERVAIAIVRAWVDEEAGAAPRCRIVTSLDVLTESTTTVVGSKDDVRVAVGRWLEELVNSLI